MARKRTRWTKRKLFAVKFKGREPRQLLWRKDVYEEWFNYARLHLTRGGKVPREFGDLWSFGDFEEWWRDPSYGFELFCEPPLETMVETVDGSSKQELGADELLLKINLRADPDILEAELKRVLQSVELGDEYKSQARFQPSKPMRHLKFKSAAGSLREMRETFELSEKMTHREVCERLGWIKVKEEDFLIRNAGNRLEAKKDYLMFVKGRLRRVIRHRRFVLDAFERIEQGSFP